MRCGLGGIIEPKRKRERWGAERLKKGNDGIAMRGEKKKGKGGEIGFGRGNKWEREGGRERRWERENLGGIYCDIWFVFLHEVS
jgi:hypothetical protein